MVMMTCLYAGPNKAWSEVPSGSGGVIIPYLRTISLINSRSSTSFGYSDCLKWGYDGSIKVAAFNATQAVGILGLDLTRVGSLASTRYVPCIWHCWY